jgi:hypothetical protein
MNRAIGRQLSYYTYDKDSGVVDPAAFPGSPDIVLETAPVERWDTNIMQEDGRTKFLVMVEEINRWSAICGKYYVVGVWGLHRQWPPSRVSDQWDACLRTPKRFMIHWAGLPSPLKRVQACPVGPRAERLTVLLRSVSISSLSGGGRVPVVHDGRSLVCFLSSLPIVSLGRC